MSVDSVETYDKAAAELIARYRDSALQIAKNRVAQFEGEGDWKMHRRSLMVLTSVEKLMAEACATRR
jgi:hypothetical protein